jgi:outer membrane protein assembly factor BamD (BamD/ComL family)
MQHLIRSLILSSTLAAPVMVTAADASSFQTAYEQIEVDPSSATAEQIIELIKLGEASGNNAQAALLVDQYLAVHLSPSPELLRLGGLLALRIGQLETGAERLRVYLSTASDTEESAQLLGILMRTWVDQLNRQDDAYQFMVQQGRNLRQAPAAANFDGWAVRQAIARERYDHLAQLLSSMLPGRAEAQARAVLWPAVDQMFSALARGNVRENQLDSIDAESKTILGALSADPARQAYGRFASSMAALWVEQRVEGGKDESLARAQQAVLPLAQRYVESAQSQEAYDLVVRALFFKGEQYDRNLVEKMPDTAAARRKVLVASQRKVRGPEQYRSAIKHADLGSVDAWLKAGADHPFFVNRHSAWQLVAPSFLRGDQAEQQLASWAQKTGDSRSAFAAMIRSLNAGKNDLARSMKHFIEKESASFRFRDAYFIVQRGIVPGTQSLIGKGDKDARAAAISGQVWLDSIGKWIATSPLLVGDFDRSEALSDYLKQVHAHGGNRQVEYLRAIQWVPLNSKNLRRTIGGDGRRFSDLQKQMRDDIKRKRGKFTQAQLDYQGKVVAEIQKLMAIAEGKAEVSKAPNALTSAYVEARKAAFAKDQETYDSGTAKLIEALGGADFLVRRAPLARGYLDLLTYRKRKSVAVYKPSAALIRATAQASNPAQDSWALDTLMRIISGGHDNRWPGDIEGRYRDTALKYNKAFAEAVTALTAKNQFHAPTFELFRQTRRGRGWHEKELNQKILEDILAKDLLVANKYRLWAHSGRFSKSAVASTMALIRYDFPGLQEKYNLADGFAEAFIQEAQANKYFDLRYFELGKDKDGKIIAAAAQHFGAMKDFPFKSFDPAVVYSRDDFYGWENKILASKSATPYQKAVAQSNRIDAAGIGVAALGFAPWDLSDDKQRRQFLGFVQRYNQRSEALPVRPALPSMAALGKLNGPLSADELQILQTTVVDRGQRVYAQNRGYDALAIAMIDGHRAAGPSTQALEAVPALWSIVRSVDAKSAAAKLVNWAGELLEAGENDENNTASKELAGVIAETGLNLATVRLSDEQNLELRRIRSAALSSTSLRPPVDETDPRYSIYKAQIDWTLGRSESAQRELNKTGAREPMTSMLIELNPQFVLWDIKNLIVAQEFRQAEGLVRAMQQHLQSAGASEPELRASFFVVQGDIARAERVYPLARAQYQAVVVNDEFAGTRAQLQADLNVADIDRLTGALDQAEQRLKEIARRPDIYAQGMAYYGLAQVAMQQSDYSQAKEHVESTLGLLPQLTEATLLQGRINLARRNAGEVTNISIGPSEDNNVHIAGTVLSIPIEDKDGSLSRRGETIILTVRSEKSGDEEQLLLSQAGDSNAKYIGQLPTVLGPGSPDDGTLQTFGQDTITYQLAQDFIESVNYRGDNDPQQLTVRSDAFLSVSSGKLQTQAELEEERLRVEFGIVSGDQQEDDGSLADRREGNEVKPGNTINVLVEDLDMSTDGTPNEIAVRLTSSSGDTVSGMKLVETGPNTGEFRVAVRTSQRPAYAFATSTTALSNPNDAISPDPDLPAWTASSSDGTLPRFGVDTNDLIHPRTMTIDLPADQEWRQFVVETSLNKEVYTARAGFGVELPQWDGAPMVEVAAVDGSQRAQLIDYQSVNEFFSYGYLTKANGAGRAQVAAPGLALNEELVKKAFDKLRKKVGGSQPERVLMRVRGVIYVPERTVRTFRFEPDAKVEDFALFINGEGEFRTRIKQPTGESYLEAVVELGRGVHTVEYVTINKLGRNWSGMATTSLVVDSPQPPYLVTPEASVFDTSAMPGFKDQFEQPKQASVQPSAGGSGYTVSFPSGIDARIVRVSMLDFEGPAPSIQKVNLNEHNGTERLPLKFNYRDLMKNDVLEIAPGDRISVFYEDNSTLRGEPRMFEAFMSATYTNGSVQALFHEIDTSEDVPKESFIPLRRFEPGDPITVKINDPDHDVSDLADVLDFEVTSSSGLKVTLQAVETEEHSGIFQGRFFPVVGGDMAGREDAIQIGAGDDLEVSYLDSENTDQGIPWQRRVTLEQVVWSDPELRVLSTQSQLIDESADTGKSRKKEEPDLLGQEVFKPRYDLVQERPTDPTDTGTFVLGGPLQAEIVWPTHAKSPESSLELYVQTSAGREMWQQEEGGVPFDIEVPGTVLITAWPSAPGGAGALPPAYRSLIQAGEKPLGSPLDVGSFAFNIPARLASLPDESWASEEVIFDMKERGDEYYLAVRPNDTIYVGFRYEDKDGVEQWLTGSLSIQGDGLFDVMDRRYTEIVSEAFVGDSVYLRVIDPTQDLTEEKGRLELAVSVQRLDKGPASKELPTDYSLELVETLSHSGIFRNPVKILHVDDPAAESELNAIPVQYGDLVRFTYGSGSQEITHELQVNLGSDGTVQSFTKRFKDPDIAVKTQFSIAEAYFEMAKKHRSLAEAEEKKAAQQNKPTRAADSLRALARKGINTGKKILEEALRDFPDNSIKAQADYLLAELELEVANETVNERMKERAYQSAIVRFGNIVSDYSDSEYAPKAQYKKALTYEKMGQMQLASEEYVKLSYRYPDHELVADTIARLGRYFLTQGKAAIDEGDALIEQGEDVEGYKKREQGLKTYTTAGDVFSKLRHRFPGHQLAAKASVLAGMCYKNGHKWVDAVAVLDEVIDDKSISDASLKAEAMYWKGDTYMQKIALAETNGTGVETDDAVAAFRAFKQLTWDFPETKWARYARGQLAGETVLQAVDAGSR